MKGESNLNPENMKIPLEVLKEYNLSDFLMTSLTCNSTKDPLFKLNPLFENYFNVCSENLPYKDIYKADSMFPHEFHKQVKQIVEQGKIKKLGNYQELLVLAEREKSKYEFLVKGTEVG
ncbi:hypothetical protein [Peribacillus simplex]|uniref:hypothetical protein n=1 Tax=Peribacillus simplex TaxID=1478 RepID=UPI002E20F6B3|nr:hypothetical protein [Peribacillus simplex]